MSDNWEKLKEKGNRYFKEGKYEEAIEYYERAIRINTEQEILYSNKGTCEKLLGNYKKSIKDYKKSLEINPKNAKNINRLSSVLILIGNFGEALEYENKCIALEPNNENYINQLKCIKKLIDDENKLSDKIKNEKYEDAEEICRVMLEKAKGYTNLKLQFLKILLENVKLDEAFNFILKNVTNEEVYKNWEFDFYLLKIFYFNGVYDKAKKQVIKLENRINDILIENPVKLINEYKNKLEKIEILKNEANELFKKKEYENAIKEYTKTLEFDPENKKFNSLILANRALCYQKLNKNIEALKDSNLSIKLNPYYGRGYLKRGNVYISLQMYDEAKNDFQKAKELDPKLKDIDIFLNEAKRLSNKKRNYYEILGITRNANAKEIKKAYKSMAMKYHPDRNSESEETKKMAEKKMIDIIDAYNVLSDQNKRSLFDQGIDPLNPEESSGSNYSFNETGASSFFQTFFNQGNSSGTNSGNFRTTFNFGGPGSGGFTFTFC